MTQESWRWLRDIMLAAHPAEAEVWRHPDDIVTALVAALPVFRGVEQAAPPAEFRIAGQKIARQPHR